MTVTQTVVREFEVDLVVRDADQVAQDVVAMTLAHPLGRGPAGLDARAPTST